MLQWLDDFFFYELSESELLNTLDELFRVCTEVGIKVHSDKSMLFAQNVQFCGHIISREGAQYHPRHLEALVRKSKPKISVEF